MRTTVPSSAAEVIADPRAFLDALREGRAGPVPDFDTRAAVAWVDALAEVDDDEDEAGDMVSLLKDDTGIDNTLFVSTKGYVSCRHGPRVKIAIDPAHRFIAGGKSASMAIHGYGIRGEYVSPMLAEQVRSFIELNRAALLAYWEGEIGTREFLNRVKPIS